MYHQEYTVVYGKFLSILYAYIKNRNMFRHQLKTVIATQLFEMYFPHSHRVFLTYPYETAQEVSVFHVSLTFNAWYLIKFIVLKEETIKLQFVSR